MTIATDLRTETARILARHYGGIPDAIAAIRVSTVEKISAYVEAAEDRAAACTCETPQAFVINTRRHNGPLDAQLTLARLRRMAREEAAA
jgi:hypothetical protein